MEQLTGGNVGFFTQQQVLRKKAKVIKRTQCVKKKYRHESADSNYGGDVENKITGVADMSEQEFEDAKIEFLSRLSRVDSCAIETRTFGQSCNPEWHKERCLRLTASNFGKVCKMRSTTNTAKTVEHILHSKSFLTSLPPPLLYGIENESIAIQKFQEQTGIDVLKCGLFIDKENPFLAASPDGLIGSDAIVEVKCPYGSRNFTIENAIVDKTLDYLTLGNDGHIALKPTHNYMYQIQGQLHITKRDICYFIVYTKLDLMYCKIERDDLFWVDKMQLYLEKFYMKALLPEIVDSRVKRNQPLRNLKIKDL